MKMQQKLRENNDYKNRYKENDRRKFDFDDESKRLFSNPYSIRFMIEDRYCQCGKVRTMYMDKSNGNVDAKSDVQFYDVDKFTNSVLHLDKGAVYLTKKSLMLNQFLEGAVDTTKTLKSTDNADWFTARNNRQYSNFNNFDVAVEKSRNRNARTICLPFSTLFLDKRLVSLFRSVALYWFFCLNTVFTKGEIFKRKNFTTVDVYGDTDLLASSSDSVALDVNMSFLARNSLDTLGDDLLWRLILETIREHETVRKNTLLLSFEEHSKAKLFEKMCRNILRNLIIDSYVQKLLPGASIALTEDRYATNRFRKKYNKKYLANVQDGSSWGENNRPCDRSHVEELEKHEFTERIDDTASETRGDKFPAITAEYFLYVINDETGGIQNNSANPNPSTNANSDSDVNENESESTDFRNVLKNIGSEYHQENDDKDDNDHNEVTNEDEDLNVTAAFFDQDYYFLPKGMFGVEEKDYPLYNLWCSPLIIEEILSQNSSFKNKMGTINDDGRSKNSFKPYRLWESSFTAEEDYIPNIYVQEKFSVFSMSRQSNAAKPQADEKPSMYNLWGSPNIIDFLPGIASVRYVNDDESLTNSSTPSSASDSFNLDVGEETFQILKSRQHYQRDKCFGRGKFFNLKPAMSGLVSFTDRGAFKYYKKPATQVAEFGKESISLCPTLPPSIIVADDTDTDTEVIGINQIVNKSPSANNSSSPTSMTFSSTNTTASYYFKPIQPAFKVETDAPPSLERSPSRTYYHQEKKLYAFKHELDVQLNDDRVFKPKFVVSSNDKACQTENIYCSPSRRFQTIPKNSLRHNTLMNQKRTPRSSPPNQFPNEAFFYSLEDVFNFLGQPGLTNIDMRNQIDFSHLFSS